MLSDLPYLLEYINTLYAFTSLYKREHDEDISPEETDVDRKEEGKGEQRTKNKENKSCSVPKKRAIEKDKAALTFNNLLLARLISSIMCSVRNKQNSI